MIHVEYAPSTTCNFSTINPPLKAISVPLIPKNIPHKEAGPNSAGLAKKKQDAMRKEIVTRIVVHPANKPNKNNWAVAPKIKKLETPDSAFAAGDAALLENVAAAIMQQNWTHSMESSPLMEEKITHREAHSNIQGMGVNS